MFHSTRLPSKAVFDHVFAYLSSKTDVINFWRGTKHSVSVDEKQSKKKSSRGPQRKLKKKDEFFYTSEAKTGPPKSVSCRYVPSFAVFDIIKGECKQSVYLLFGRGRQCNRCTGSRGCDCKQFCK